MSKYNKDNRFEIIIEEIHYWKSHKILPENYCDYLLALYTNGESEVVEKRVFIRKIITIIQIFLCFLLLPFSFLVIYFTKFTIVLQIAMLILFITYSFWCYKYLKERDNRYYHIVLVVTLFIILLFSTFLGNIWIVNSFVTFSILILNFLFWFYIGKKGNVFYLKIVSIIGIVFSTFYTIF